MVAIKVLIVSANRLLTSSLVKASGREVEEGREDPVEITRVIEKGSVVIKACMEKTFDVVIIDSALPDMKAYEVCRLLLESMSDSKIIFLVPQNSQGNVLMSQKMGLMGQVAYTFTTDEFFNAVRQVNEGKRYFDVDVLIQLQQMNEQKASGLTSRELQLIRLISMEKTMKEISRHMDLSIRTLQNNYSTLRKKLKVRSNIGLVVYAVKNGLV